LYCFLFFLARMSFFFPSCFLLTVLLLKIFLTSSFSIQPRYQSRISLYYILYHVNLSKNSFFIYKHPAHSPIVFFHHLFFQKWELQRYGLLNGNPNFLESFFDYFINLLISNDI
jgi:hypothetical protein